MLFLERETMPEIGALRGLWRRSLIAWPDGRRDTTTDVHWLQGESLYADLRQPAGMPDFSHAGCLNDLSPEDCQWLALQEGFTGALSFDGLWFEWARRIDYQPVSPYSDVGALAWEGEVLVETGRDVPYVEHWHRNLPPQPPTIGLVMETTAQDTAGAFIRVGDMFMFVRDRRLSLPPLPSLRACLDSADAAQARALIDCEISFGHFESGQAMIEASSLPYRVSAGISLHLAGDRLTSTGQDDAGRAIEQTWRILAREGEGAAPI